MFIRPTDRDGWTLLARLTARPVRQGTGASTLLPISPSDGTSGDSIDRCPVAMRPTSVLDADQTATPSLSTLCYHGHLIR